VFAIRFGATNIHAYVVVCRGSNQTQQNFSLWYVLAAYILVVILILPQGAPVQHAIRHNGIRYDTVRYDTIRASDRGLG